MAQTQRHRWPYKYIEFISFVPSDRTVCVLTNIKTKKTPFEHLFLFHAIKGTFTVYTESNSFHRVYNVICIFTQVVHIIRFP